MKKLLALLFIFVSLSGLKAEPPIGNSGTSEELTRESVSVPTQKQVQDVPVQGKPTWGKTIKAMYNQHPIKFAASAATIMIPVGIFIKDAARVISECNRITSVQNSPEKVMKVISGIYGSPFKAGLHYLLYGGSFIVGLYSIYLSTEIPIQGTPKVELSDDKK